jgi:hypothetical protein
MNFIWISSTYSFIKKIASTTEEHNVFQEEALPSPELVEGFSKNHSQNKEKTWFLTETTNPNNYSLLVKISY